MLTVHIEAVASNNDKYIQKTYQVTYRWKKEATRFKCLRAFEVSGMVGDLIKRLGCVGVKFDNELNLFNQSNKQLLLEFIGA